MTPPFTTGPTLIAVVRRPGGWLTQLVVYKPFLVVLGLLATLGLLLKKFLTYPLGLGIWLYLH